MLFIVKPVLIRNFVDNLGMFICVLLAVLYGLYMIYETKFILDGTLFQADYHEVFFAAFMLQFDMTGVLIWWMETRLGVKIHRDFD